VSSSSGGGSASLQISSRSDGSVGGSEGRSSPRGLPVMFSEWLVSSSSAGVGVGLRGGVAALLRGGGGECRTGLVPGAPNASGGPVPATGGTDRGLGGTGTAPVDGVGTMELRLRVRVAMPSPAVVVDDDRRVVRVGRVVLGRVPVSLGLGGGSCCGSWLSPMRRCGRDVSLNGARHADCYLAELLRVRDVGLQFLDQLLGYFLQLRPSPVHVVSSLLLAGKARPECPAESSDSTILGDFTCEW